MELGEQGGGKGVNMTGWNQLYLVHVCKYSFPTICTILVKYSILKSIWVNNKRYYAEINMMIDT